MITIEIVLHDIFTYLLLTVILFAVVKYKNTRNIFKMLTLLSLIVLGSTVKIFGPLIRYGLPTNVNLSGTSYPFIPIISGIVILLLTFPLILTSNKETVVSSYRTAFKRWVWFFSGTIIQLMAFLVIVTICYMSLSIRNNLLWLYCATSISLALTITGSIFLYYSSRMNTPDQPNVMRWTASISLLIFAYLSFAPVLLILYIVPQMTQTTYPLVAELLTLDHVFIAVTLVGIGREYCNKKALQEMLEKQVTEAQQLRDRP